MMNWFRRKRELEPLPHDVVAVSSIRAMPVTINAGQVERIVRAKYRLDAILRHVAQHASISEQKRAEFRREARVHIANLLAVGDMTEEEAREHARALDL